MASRLDLARRRRGRQEREGVGEREKWGEERGK